MAILEKIIEDAKGNNLGLTKGKSKYAFILNPDATLEENTITVRDRDTMKQKRISETRLEEEFKKLF